VSEEKTVTELLSLNKNRQVFMIQTGGKNTGSAAAHNNFSLSKKHFK